CSQRADRRRRGRSEVTLRALQPGDGVLEKGRLPEGQGRLSSGYCLGARYCFQLRRTGERVRPDGGRRGSSEELPSGFTSRTANVESAFGISQGVPAPNAISKGSRRIRHCRETGP